MSERDPLRAVLTAMVLSADPATAFFSALTLRLRWVPTDAVETLVTDGRTVWYSPRYLAGLTDDEVEFSVCHEVLHPGLRHFERFAGLDPRRSNEAGDLAINDRLTRAGMVPPAGALIPGVGPHRTLERGLSAEEYYAILEERDAGQPGDGQEDAGQPGDEQQGEGQPDAGQQGAGQPGDGAVPQAAREARDPGGCGTWIAPDDPDEVAVETEVAMAQAAMAAEQAARGAGQDVPDFVREILDRATEARVDWRNVLREFVGHAARSDYSWRRPNRRSLGVILPSVYSQDLGRVVVAVDTSGSVSDDEVRGYLREVEDVLGAYDCEALVLLHHVRVYARVEWQPSDGPIQVPQIQTGGTSHRKVFEAVEAEQPVLFVGFSDLYSDLDSIPEPDCPVLWAVERSHGRAPWGQVVSLAK
jgi:predicted metal-dependent peptidase